MKIIDNNLNYDKISTFLKASQYSNYMQSPNWAKYRLDKGYFELAMYDSNDNIVAYGVAYSLQKYNKNYLYFPRGPVINYNNIEDLELFRKAILDYIKEHNFEGILLDPAINQLNIKYKIKNNCDYCSQQYSSQEAIVNLNCIKENDLLHILKSNTRYYINKAIKNNLKYSISNNAFDLDTFLILYNENAKKRNFPPKTKEELTKFINSNNVIFIQTLKDDVPVNMSICIIHNDTMYYVLGANNKKLDLFHGSYFLHYHSMLYAISILRFKKMFVNTFTNFLGEIEIE